MKIAICASEGAPYAKSGGLGDVMEALPSALARIAGNEVVLFLPYYHKIKTNTAYMVEQVAEIRVQLGWRQQYCGIMKLTNRNDGVQVYFLDNDYYFGARTGAIYGDMDDGERFAFFSRGCLDAMIALNFIPEIIQCNDWQTACIPIYLKAMYHGAFYKTRCMYTIHNIEYQGWANAGFFDDVLGLPWEYRSTLDMSNSVNVMKGAIETADLVTTVSETYARELMYPYYAHGSGQRPCGQRLEAHRHHQRHRREHLQPGDRSRAPRPLQFRDLCRGQGRREGRPAKRSGSARQA